MRYNRDHAHFACLRSCRLPLPVGAILATAYRNDLNGMWGIARGPVCMVVHQLPDMQRPMFF